MRINANITTEAEALNMIRTLAKDFRLFGAGYLGIDDLARALESIQDSYPIMPSLEEDDMSSLLEHLSLSTYWKDALVASEIESLELAVLDEIKEWYEDSEQMNQERDANANPRWHSKMAAFLQELPKNH